MNKVYSIKQITMLTLLRVAIGWHFLYEGLYKLLNHGWSATSFLQNSTGPFASVFKEWTKSASTMSTIDALNIWGLILIGTCLFLGLFEKPAKVLGVILLSLYYLTYPPFSSMVANLHVDGNFWIVDRNLIEILALLVLMVFPTSHYTGVDRLVVNSRIKKNNFLFKVLYHQ